MTYESDSDGVSELVAAEGDTLPIGAVIARLNGSAAGEPQPLRRKRSEDSAAPADKRRLPPPGNHPPLPSRPRRRPLPRRRPGARRAASAARDGRRAGQGLAGGAADGARARRRPRRAARVRAGRADREGRRRGGGRGGAPAAAPAPAAGGSRRAAPRRPPRPRLPARPRARSTSEELTRTQQTIARRMAESKATVPDFTLQTDVDMEQAVVALRGSSRRRRARTTCVPSFNDIVVKACALALREYPRANGGYSDGRFELYARVNVGVAVAAQDALVVPTVFDADRKTLGEIAARDAGAGRARARRRRSRRPSSAAARSPSRTSACTACASSRRSSTRRRPAILSVGAVAAAAGRARRRDRRPPHDELTLVCDHRILYGADAASSSPRSASCSRRPLSLAL